METELNDTRELRRVIWTIGHSTRAIAEFLELLDTWNVNVICDVRRFAGSRTNPQYGPASLAASLENAGVAYRPVPALGGRRKPLADSPNGVWRNDAFRGYADYMETDEFLAGLRELEEIAATANVAILCSEAVWWRCHRSMIADALKARGFEVRHIMSATSAPEHPYTAPARVVDGRLTYRTNG